MTSRARALVGRALCVLGLPVMLVCLVYLLVVDPRAVALAVAIPLGLVIATAPVLAVLALMVGGVALVDALFDRLTARVTR
jgi:hypothetical protein